MALGDSQAGVFIENNMTESFNVNIGVRQCDALSVIRFNLVLDYIIKEVAIRGNISTKVVQINAYTDDVIITWNLKTLEEALQNLDNTAQEVGLKISQEKQNEKTHNHCKQIAVAGYRFERVSCFPYLGSVLNDDNSIAEEITHRIEKGNKCLLWSRGCVLPLSTQVRGFKPGRSCQDF
jgi:hypothetical protein